MSALTSRFSKWQTWVTSAGLCAVAVVLYYLVSSLLQPDSAPGSAHDQLVLHDVLAQGKNGSRSGWSFNAGSTDLSTDGSVATYHNVKSGTYYIAGKAIYGLTAGIVSLDMRSQNYSASGGVHVYSMSGREPQDFNTAQIFWNNALQVLSCPSAVHVRYKNTSMDTSQLSVNFKNGDTTFGKTDISF